MTPKQQRFVEEYLVDLNATQAAIRSGYSPNTAQEQGARLLSKAMVADAVRKAQADRTERTEINADWVLSRLGEEARADIADLFDDNYRLKPVPEWPLIWRQGLVSGIEVEELFEGRGEDRENIGRLHKVKLSDRIKRIELIGKHIGVQAFRDRVEVDVSEDAAALLAQARQAAA